MMRRIKAFVLSKAFVFAQIFLSLTLDFHPILIFAINIDTLIDSYRKANIIRPM